VADRDAITADFARKQDIGASVNYLLVGLIMGYAAISVVNTPGDGDRQAAGREFGFAAADRLHPRARSCG